jgi:hypothetical protein
VCEESDGHFLGSMEIHDGSYETACCMSTDELSIRFGTGAIEKSTKFFGMRGEGSTTCVPTMSDVFLGKIESQRC